jgi:16S rRNA processing protein RimM
VAETLLAGRVGKPHGLDGSFVVEEGRPELLEEGARVVVDGRELRIDRRAGTDQRPIVRLEGCASREDAERLRRHELRVPRTQAPALEDGEYWAQELIGCRVHDGVKEVGVVSGLLALPSCEALEVTGGDDAGGDPLLVPLVADAVRSIDVPGRRIEIDLGFLGAAWQGEKTGGG